MQHYAECKTARFWLIALFCSICLSGCITLLGTADDANGDETSKVAPYNPCSAALRDERLWCRNLERSRDSRQPYRCLTARRWVERSCFSG